MLVSHKLRMIYIHVPKTGGSSVTVALLPFLGGVGRNPKLVVGKLGWQKWAHYRGMMHAGSRGGVGLEPLVRWPKYRVLITVRNPWDRFASLARNLHKRNGKNLWDGNLWTLERRLRGTRKFPRRYWFQACARWLPQGREVRVLRFERLAEDWREWVRWERSAGEFSSLPSEELPHVNRSRKKEDWREYYPEGDVDLVEAVRRRFHEDVDRFGYSFAL